MRRTAANPAGTATPTPAGGCAATGGTAGSWTRPAARASSGRAWACARPTWSPGWTPPAPHTGSPSRTCRSTRRGLRRRRAARAAGRGGRPRPLPHGPAPEHLGHRRPPPPHPQHPAPTRTRDRTRVDQPAATAHRPGRTVQKRFCPDVDGPVDADPIGELLSAYTSKEELRRPVRPGQSRRATRPDPGPPTPLLPVVGGLRYSIFPKRSGSPTTKPWWPANEALLTTGITNSRTEGTNRLAKDVACRACGLVAPLGLRGTRQSRRAPASVGR